MFVQHLTLKSGTTIKILPLDFLVTSHRIPWKNKNAVHRLQISALVPEIFVFEKYVKYVELSWPICTTDHWNLVD